MSEPTPVEILTQGEDAAELYHAIDGLKWDYKEVIILRKVNELSIKDTAFILNWGEEKGKNMTARAQKSLQKKMKEKGEDFIG